MGDVARTSTKTNMALALSAQLVVLLVGVVKSLLLPHAMDVSSYAYWQQYLLYAGFVGIFALGFNDGVYLLYGDKDYDELPFGRLRAAFRLYCLMLGIISLVVGLYAWTISDPSRSFAFLFVAIDIFIACVSGLFIYVLQITNQFKWYSICTIADKVVFIALAVALIFGNLVDFRLFIVMDVLSRVVALALICWRCRRLVVGPRDSLTAGLRETVRDIRVGISLMFANFASMLTTNLGRFVIDLFGGLANYAFYSFGMSVTNLVLTFVSAAGTVLYPALKRIDEANLAGYYRKIDKGVLAVGCVGLAMYFPVQVAISLFYAKYAPVLSYLNILFLAAFFQAKMTLLVNTFYKTLRMEKRLFIVNAQCVVGFALLALLTYGTTHDVWWVAMSTAVTAGARCVWSELELSSRLRVGVRRTLAFQIVAAVLFFALSSFVPVVAAAPGFVVSLVALAFFAKKAPSGVFGGESK